METKVRTTLEDRVVDLLTTLSQLILFLPRASVHRASAVLPADTNLLNNILISMQITLEAR